jgi:catechol 2,3-dioxygenase-like lactoylglutathione lyase family enzyme
LASAVDVERVDFVTIPTRDEDRLREWYRDVLGLAVDPNNPRELTCGQVTLAFWVPEDEGIEFTPNPSGVGLRVADVEKACAELEARGVEVVGVEDTGVCHMGFLEDADGNWVILHRRYKPYE